MRSKISPLRALRARASGLSRTKTSPHSTPSSKRTPPSSLLTRLSPSLAFTTPFLSSDDTPSTLIQSLSHLYLQHPLPTYTSSIILLTILIRSTLTLPITIVARSRLSRISKYITPQISQHNRLVAQELVPICRTRGLGHDDYVEVLSGELKAERVRLLKVYGVRPRLWAWLPPLFHLPIFVGLSFTFREATRLAEEANTIEITNRAAAAAAGNPTHPDSSSIIESSPSPIDIIPHTTPTHDLLTSDPTLLTHIHQFLTEQPLYLSSLIDPDPTLILPLLIGLSTFTNIEILQSTRAAREGAGGSGASGSGGEPKKQSITETTPQGKIIPNPARRVSAKDKARPTSVHRDNPNGNGKAVGEMKLETMKLGGREAEDREKAMGLFGRTVGFALRGFAIVSVGIASQVPAAVAIYWSTTTIYSLLQNLLLTRLEKTNSLPFMNPSPEQFSAAAAIGNVGAGMAVGSGLVRQGEVMAMRRRLTDLVEEGVRRGEFVPVVKPAGAKKMRGGR